jgi:hypothetical protein
MAAAYSMDLRERVIKDAKAGLSSKELAVRYHVSRAWVDALKQREGLSTAAALATIWRELHQLGITVKKNGTRRRTAPP